MRREVQGLDDSALRLHREVLAQALQGETAPEVVTPRKTHVDKGVETLIGTLHVLGVETHVVKGRNIAVRLK